jgi:hypothetical protein
MNHFIFHCLCNLPHIINGECCCWACRSRFDPVPKTVNRQVYLDMCAMRWSSERMHKATHDRDERTPYDRCWADQPGLGSSRNELL